METIQTPPGFDETHYDVEQENMYSALLYIKELLLPIIYGEIKSFNREMENRARLIISGGEAIKTLFPEAKELITYDVDLKLVVPKEYVFTEALMNTLLKIAGEFIRFLAEQLEEYLNTRYSIYDDVYENYGVRISSIEGNKTGKTLYECGFYVNYKYVSVVDLFVPNKKDISHYKTFITDPLLGKGTNKYYIPTFSFQELDFAALGYVLWDTQRMIDANTIKKTRYINKYKAIIAALNEPEKTVSCPVVQGFVEKCYRELSMEDCQVGDAKVALKGIVQYGIEIGHIPEQYRDIFETEFDKPYVCQYIQKLNKEK